MLRSRNHDDSTAKPRFAQRLSSVFLKPAPPSESAAEPEAPSLDELEESVKRSNDKERLVGLIAAPWAAGIGLLVTSALISNDPAAQLANGQANKLHVSVSLYHEVMLVLVILSILMLAFSLLRKRLYVGIVMALFGLAVFNLHYWGFGIPFILAAAWFLVRSYRYQRAWREAGGQAAWRPGSGRSSSLDARPRANKRYTPPRPS